MTTKLLLSLGAVLLFLAARAPTENDPKRSLTYKAPDQEVEPGFSRNEGFRGRQTFWSSRTSNRFGRSRGTIRSRNSRRGRIGR